MKRVDTSLPHWIKRQAALRPSIEVDADLTHENYFWFFLTACCPLCFEKYAVVLNPLWVNWKENSTIETQILDSEEKLFAEGYERISWGKFFKLYNKDFSLSSAHEGLETIIDLPNQNGTPTEVLYPEEGSCETAELEFILKKLLDLYGDIQVNFYYCFLKVVGCTDAVTYRGLLSEFKDLENQELLIDNPTAIYPADQSWCIITDYDLTATYVAGSKVFIDSLTGTSEFDIYELEPRFQEKQDKFDDLPLEQIQLRSMQGHMAIEFYDYSIAVDWAIEQIRQDKETENVLILAGFSEPIDHYEIAPYVTAVLYDLGLPELDSEESLIAIAHFHVFRIVQDESPRKHLELLQRLCEHYDHATSLMDFWELYHSWGDLEDLGTSFHYFGVTKENYNFVVKRVAENWISKYIHGEDPPEIVLLSEPQPELRVQRPTKDFSSGAERKSSWLRVLWEKLTRSRFQLIPLIFSLSILSCAKSSTEFNLNPIVEVINEEKVLWNTKPLYLNQLDSVLSDYRNTIPEYLRESIRLKLIVPTPETSFSTIQKVKITLRKNQIFKLTYVMKK